MDSVQDLRAQVARRINAERPWTADGKLLFGTQILEDAVLLKDADLADPCELQFLAAARGQALERSDLVLLPEVVQKFLDPCQVRPYKPDVQWVLKDFAIRSTEQELVADWQRESEREDVLRWDQTDPTSRFEPWLQLKEGHLGVRRNRHTVLSCDCHNGCFHFSYYGFINPTHRPKEMEDPSVPSGWHPDGSFEDARGMASAPLLYPR
ncbi:unnamed protein product, partial [Symbiodinium pilosum]